MAVAWSPNNQRIAVATNDRVIHLFDEMGERKDKFPTKPADPKTRNYSILSLAWSPCSTRLAICQSDNVVFVYKLGIEWGEKKSICNKLIQQVEVTCLVWPLEQPNAVVLGLVDGKVQLNL
jgi:intraflagellar transport protein 172